MGPYCQFCGRRCFVERTTPPTLNPDGYLGHTLLMATCAPGMTHDARVTGFTHVTAYNPATEIWR